MADFARMPHILLPAHVARRIMGQSKMMQGMSLEGSAQNPICPRCERVALRDKGYSESRTGRCPHCGYHGKMDTTAREYINKKMYK